MKEKPITLFIYEANSKFDSEVFTLEPNKAITMGKSNSDILLNDNFVSSKHCHIVNYNHKLLLIDQNSSNGTFLNGKKVKKIYLKDNDLITIGGYEMIIRLVDDSTEIKRIEELSATGKTARHGAKRSGTAKTSMKGDRGAGQLDLQRVLMEYLSTFQKIILKPAQFFEDSIGGESSQINTFPAVSAVFSFLFYFIIYFIIDRTGYVAKTFSLAINQKFMDSLSEIERIPVSFFSLFLSLSVLTYITIKINDIICKKSSRKDQSEITKNMFGAVSTIFPVLFILLPFAGQSVLYLLIYFLLIIMIGLTRIYKLPLQLVLIRFGFVLLGIFFIAQGIIYFIVNKR